MKISTLYFSATYTTHRIVGHVAKRISDEVAEYDITNVGPKDEIVVPKEDLLIVGVPVYAGRVPALAVERIRKFKGEGTPAIAIYLPALIACSIITGLFTGLCAQILVNRGKDIWKTFFK
jgi:flavodoxin